MEKLTIILYLRNRYKCSSETENPFGPAMSDDMSGEVEPGSIPLDTPRTIQKKLALQWGATPPNISTSGEREGEQIKVKDNNVIIILIIHKRRRRKRKRRSDVRHYLIGY